MRTARILLCVTILLTGAALEVCSQTTPWVTVYYAGWTMWSPNPVDIPQIDFSTGTHWIFFTLVPTSSGSFDGNASGIDDTRHTQFVAAAHAAGRKAIIGTGGWGADYTGVVTNRTTSIDYLVNLMTTYGYDGIDVDWEPVAADQYANFAAWVSALKAAMLKVKSHAVLTAAAFAFDQALVNSRQYFDQINLMTYDMSGPWPGWVSWHNSAIFNGGNTFPSTGGPLPSIDRSITEYIGAGIPSAKLGFGIEFYGYIWDGVNGPRQTGFGNVQNSVPYSEIMSTYGGHKPQWDAAAQAAYYSTSSQFISFDAETTMAVKAKYVQAKGLGGVIIYEFSGGYQSDAPSGLKDHLIQTVKQAFLQFTVTDVNSQNRQGVTDFALHQNYPNPFNPSTTIEFDLPAQSEASVRIYSLLGREVALLYSGSASAGRHSVVWNAAGFSSGTYFCRFKAGSHVDVRRLVLLK